MVRVLALCCVALAHSHFRQQGQAPLGATADAVPEILLDATSTRQGQLQMLDGHYVYDDPHIGPVLAGPVDPLDSSTPSEFIIRSPEGIPLSFNQNTPVKPTAATAGGEREAPLPTCPAKPDTTPEELLAQLAEAGITKCFDKNATSIPWTESDNQNEFASRGGDATAHTYGEVSFQGMLDILNEAVRISMNMTSTNASNVTKEEYSSSMSEISKHFGDYEFYDLGSGFGKFPLYASFLGFNRAVGIELDKHRAGFADTRFKTVQKEFPCYGEKLAYHQGSFLNEHVEWAKGKQKRIIFMDAVCWGSLWKELVAVFDYAEWDEHTVVAAIGQASLGARFQPMGTKFVKVSWMNSAGVHFFQKKSGLDPLPKRGPAWRKLQK